MERPDQSSERSPGQLPEQPIDDDSVKTGVLVSAVLHVALILAAIAPVREALPPVEGAVQIQLISMDDFNRIFGAADAAASPSTAISEDREQTPRPDQDAPTVDSPQPEPSMEVAAMVNPSLPEAPPVAVDRPEPLILETPEITAPAPLVPPALVDAPAEAVDLSAPPAPEVTQPAPLSPLRGVETGVDIAVDRDTPPPPAQTPAAAPEPTTPDPNAAVAAAAPIETPLAPEPAETRPAEQSAPTVPEPVETAETEPTNPRPPRLRPQRRPDAQIAAIPAPPRLRPRREQPVIQPAIQPVIEAVIQAAARQTAPEPLPRPSQRPSQRPQGDPGLAPADDAPLAESDTLPSQTLTPLGDATQTAAAQFQTPPPPVPTPPGLTFGQARDILRTAQAAWLQDAQFAQSGFASYVNPEDVRRRIDGLEETRADIVRYGLPNGQRLQIDDLIARNRQLLNTISPTSFGRDVAAAGRPPEPPAPKPQQTRPEQTPPQITPRDNRAADEDALRRQREAAAAEAEEDARRRQREAAAARRAAARRERQRLEDQRQQGRARRRQGRLEDAQTEAELLAGMFDHLRNGGATVAQPSGRAPSATAVAGAGVLDTPTSGDGSRSNLTALEARAVINQIARCWRFPNLRPPLGPDAVATLRFELNRLGEVLPRSIQRVGAPPTTETGRLAEAYARTALTRSGCGRFLLPPEKYESWRFLEFVFDTPTAIQRGDSAAGLSGR